MSDSTNSTLPSSSSTSPVSMSQSSSLSSIKGEEAKTSAGGLPRPNNLLQPVDSAIVSLKTSGMDFLSQLKEISNAQQQQDSNNNISKANDNNSTKRTTYRYTKDFLQKIREERAKFIEQIYPDIFKAYCYCMNGKYWNPEKYFDVVQYQFPGDFDKIKKNTKKQMMIKKPTMGHNSQIYNMNNNNRRQNNTMKYRAASTSGSSNTTLNMTKKSNSSYNIISNSESNRFESNEADRILLGLIKHSSKAESTISSSGSNSANGSILDKLFNQTKSPSQSILDLLNKKNTSAPVYTAAELESRNVNEGVNILNMLKGAPKRNEYINLNDSLSNNSESNIAMKEPAVFPMINPHEKPFQNLSMVEEPLNAKVSSALSQILTNAKLSPPPKQQQQQTIEDLLNKIKVNSSPSSASSSSQCSSGDDHFNSLLNKIKNPQQQQQQQSANASSNLMKWFKNMDNNQGCKLPQNVLSLKDIETLNA